jgi:hypothetical protein
MEQNHQISTTSLLTALVILIFVFAGRALCQGKSATDRNVCALASHPSHFQNKIVRIRGTAISGMEANVLVESKDGKWNQDCGRISLDFDSIGNDERTRELLILFSKQLSADCINDGEAKQAMAQDPVPA